MKVYLKKNITAYSGKDGEEDVVYSSHCNGNVCIAGNYTKPRPTIQHQTFALNGSNIRTLWNSVSVGFKNDLKSYAFIFKGRTPDLVNITSYSLFVKLLYAHAQSLGSAVSDLEYDTLKTSAAKTVSSAVTANYLPAFGLSLSYNNNM